MKLEPQRYWWTNNGMEPLPKGHFAVSQGKCAEWHKKSDVQPAIDFYNKHHERSCDHCDSLGIVPWFGEGKPTQTCPQCNGTGKQPTDEEEG